jgi:hypothetical protein
MDMNEASGATEPGVQQGLQTSMQKKHTVLVTCCQHVKDVI